MTEIGDEEPVSDSWRHYYENPLTVATTAMLHINGGEEQNNSSTTTHYELYKEEPMGSPAVVGGTLELKLANTDADGVVEASQVESIFVQGGAAEVVKREPEDLTRKCISPPDRTVLSDKRRIVSLTHGDSPPALIPTQSLKDELDIKEEGVERPRINSAHTIVIQSPLETGSKMSAVYQPGFPGSPQTYEGLHYTVSLNGSPQPNYTSSTSPVMSRSSSAYPPPGDQYFNREGYYLSTEQYSNLRPEYTTEPFDRTYSRPATSYRTIALTVDSSPDSGISSDTLSAKEQVVALPQQAFSYHEELAGQQAAILTSELRPVSVSGVSPGANRGSPIATQSTISRTWPEFSARHSEHDKIQIPKIHSEDDKVYIEKVDNPYGYKYYFESPISTSPRREDDRITYINKGQFYAISMEYHPEPDKPRNKGHLVKSVIMLLFREEKSAEDERKAWHFWHSRQHSVKQRILDIDTKNSIGIATHIEEIAHNAIAVYWNPMESTIKVNVAVQCLSTDFSSQKGVKGLPLHIQIDTYEDARDPHAPVYHRGYCQIKVFCDKGAERKTRDEERRAAKRRLNPSTRKKYEDLYHPACDRSQFYSMADTVKEPVLFKPSDDMDKVSYMGALDMPSYYSHDTDNGEFHNTSQVITNGAVGGVEDIFQPAKRTRYTPDHAHHQTSLPASTPKSDEDRLMILVRREKETVFDALHLVPPGQMGLMNAIEDKMKIRKSAIKNLYRKNRHGAVSRIDDDMLRHYCTDTPFELVVHNNGEFVDCTLVELTDIGPICISQCNN